jgi:superfamily II DNA or RNA helicase
MPLPWDAGVRPAVLVPGTARRGGDGHGVLFAAGTGDGGEAGMSERRRFNASERAALYLVAGGRCERCGRKLVPGWHADHVNPYVAGGPTDLINGQALCPKCNLLKGSHMELQPREWQRRFIAKYHSNTDPDFLLVACPGAGKTLASGFVVRDLLDDSVADRVLVVVPTAALREQWMKALAELGVIVDGLTMNNGEGEKDTIDEIRTRGWVVTYQSLYSDRGTHRILNARRPTVAVLDEIHHLGEEASWGKAAIEALGPCVRRLGLSGTPFHATRDVIPFVEFDEDGIARYKDDPDGTPYPRGFDYSYGRALQDKPAPVRPILFDQYDGDVTWLEQWTDEERVVKLSDKLNKKDRTKANRHAVDHRGDWLRTVLADAESRLQMVRQDGDPTAQGLVLCIDTRHAYAVHKALGAIVGRQAVAVAVSKDLQGRDVTEQARDTIAGFAESPARWLVAVAMVSEGIDIPTLRVGVWATIVRSPLRFRQGMGRLIRRTTLPEDIDQTAYLFVPKDPEMVKLADEVYNEVKLALLEKDQQDSGESEGQDGDVPGEDQLPFDAFRKSTAEDPSIYAPGLGGVDPAEATRIAHESGQPLGAVAAVLAWMAKSGASPAGAGPEPSAPTERQGINSYKRRLKQSQGDLETLLRQITKVWLDKNGRPYTEFGGTIAKIKAEVYGRAGIAKGQYQRADIPQINDAINIAKKWWAEL